jgi:hypothetical protein
MARRSHQDRLGQAVCQSRLGRGALSAHQNGSPQICSQMTGCLRGYPDARKVLGPHTFSAAWVGIQIAAEPVELLRQVHKIIRR